jgi:hypothetical protein
VQLNISFRQQTDLLSSLGCVSIVFVLDTRAGRLARREAIVRSSA